MAHDHHHHDHDDACNCEHHHGHEHEHHEHTHEHHHEHSLRGQLLLIAATAVLLGDNPKLQKTRFGQSYIYTEI